MTLCLGPGVGAEISSTVQPLVRLATAWGQENAELSVVVQPRRIGRHVLQTLLPIPSTPLSAWGQENAELSVVVQPRRIGRHIFQTLLPIPSTPLSERALVLLAVSLNSELDELGLNVTCEGFARPE